MAARLRGLAQTLRRNQAGDAENNHDEWNRTPPVLRESTEPVTTLAPGPEDAKHHKPRTQHEANSLHAESLSATEGSLTLATVHFASQPAVFPHVSVLARLAPVPPPQRDRVNRADQHAVPEVIDDGVGVLGEKRARCGAARA